MKKFFNVTCSRRGPKLKWEVLVDWMIFESKRNRFNGISNFPNYSFIALSSINMISKAINLHLFSSLLFASRSIGIDLFIEVVTTSNIFIADQWVGGVEWDAEYRIPNVFSNLFIISTRYQCFNVFSKLFIIWTCFQYCYLFSNLFII